MFESLIDKEIKCVFKDSNQDKAIIGKLIEISDKFLKIISRDKEVYVSIDSVISLFERSDPYV